MPVLNPLANSSTVFRSEDDMEKKETTTSFPRTFGEPKKSEYVTPKKIGMFFN